MWADDRSKMSQNVIILELHNHIFKLHEKCILISTNMPGIGSLILKEDVDISENDKKVKSVCLVVKAMPAF